MAYLPPILNYMISVIVPIYNVEKYLARCLDSILSQSYRNIEIILINDGSPDLSLTIAQTYSKKDDRITVYSFENAGLSEARNRGLEVATGDYIAYVDSDDMLLPDAFTMMLKTMEETGADIVEGRTIRRKVIGEIKYKNFYPYKTFSPEKAIEDILYQRELLPSMCGKLFKRNLFDGLKFEKNVLYEDLNIFYKVFERANLIAKSDFPVYFYRITEGSIINSWKPKRLDVLKVTENIENYISENNPAILPAAQDRRLSANFNMFALCRIHNSYDCADDCWEIIRIYRKQSLFNGKVRLKNKIGIILSYLGKEIFSFISSQFYKHQ